MICAYVGSTCDLCTNQAPPAFAVIIAVPLPKITWATVSTVVPMANRMGAADVGCSCDMGANHPALTFTVKITIPLSGPAGAAISAVIPMTDRMGAFKISTIIYIAKYLLAKQAFFTLIIMVAVTFTFVTWSANFAEVPMA